MLIGNTTLVPEHSSEQMTRSRSSSLSSIDATEAAELHYRAGNRGIFPRHSEEHRMVHVARFNKKEMAQKIKAGEAFLEAPVQPFTMKGSKRQLLGSPLLRDPLLAAMNGNVNRFVEPFAGTCITSLYLKSMGLLPNGSLLNELTPLRATDLEQTIRHPQAVINALERHILRIREICYEVMNNEAPRDHDELVAWESKAVRFDKGSVDECSEEVLKYLLGEMLQHWPEEQEAPDNNADVAAIHKILQRNSFNGNPVRLARVGTRRQEQERPMRGARRDAANGYVRLVGSCTFALKTIGSNSTIKDKRALNYTRENLGRLVDDVREVARRLQHVTFSREDGFNVASHAQLGDVLFIDPPYLQMNDDTVDFIYAGVDERDYGIDNWARLIADLEQAWSENIPIVITNRYDERLHHLLAYRNWRVSGPIENGRGLEEMVATNFDWEGGTARIRIIGKPSLVARLSEAHDKRMLNAQCKIGGAVEEREGTLIDGSLYIEDQGRPVRYVPNAGKARAAEQDSAIWHRSSNQRRLPVPGAMPSVSPYELKAASGRSSTMQRRLLAAEEQRRKDEQEIQDMPLDDAEPTDDLMDEPMEEPAHAS